MCASILIAPCGDRRILIKSGGFSTQLSVHVGNIIDGDPLWASRFDATNPAAVVQTHLDFLQSGCQIIVSNTYQASIEGYMKHLNLTKEESINLISESIKLCKVAKEKYLEIVEKANGEIEAGLPLIMASIGPYGAHLNDGSEYNGSYAERVSKEEMQQWHQPRIDACLAAEADGLAIETLPCQKEAEAVVEMMLSNYPNVKFWISFQCKDEEHLANGENFANAVQTVWQKIIAANATERFIAIGVNCVNPKYVAPLFKSVHEVLKKSKTPIPPLLVYSNRGESYDTELGEWIGREQCVPLVTFVPEWLELGAKIIGGCCRCYAEDIVPIRKYFDDLQKQ